MTPEETVKPKRTRQPKEEVKHLCHVHDNCSDVIKKLVRRSVCQNVEITEHTDGKHYCLLHLPTKEKDADKFQQIIDQRFDEVAAKVAKIEAELPEADWKEAKAKLRYDFACVWFPQDCNFKKKIFSGDADFSLATFSGDADFISATFSGYAYFRSATFIGYANFNSATFSGDADFRSATFSGDAYFRSATFSDDAYFRSATFSDDADFNSATFSSSADFSLATFSGDADFISATFSGYAYFRSATFIGYANFNSATFSGDADFRSATFSGDAYFRSATFSGETKFDKTKFGKTGETEFIKAKFEGDVLFENTEFNNPVSFNSAVFGKESDIIFRDAFFAQYASFRYSTSEGYLRFINLRQGEENRFNFEEAAFEKASRISFNKVRLRSNWFINIDSRKFSFTNISWENHKASYDELTEELDSLKKRNHKEPDNFRLLTIAFRYLATNAEEFNRLEEASNFRESAFECEKLERKHEQKVWLTNVSTTLDKRFICWDFFSETKTIITELWKLIRHAPFDLVHSLYRRLSFYGESWFRATWILFAVWFGFALFYFYFGEFGTDEKHKPLEFLYSLGYSLQVMTLQKPEPKPYGWLTVLLYGMETIFAPLQAALLALAIRRKFMR
jgi:Pentapeptide repeats (9 copies)